MSRSKPHKSQPTAQPQAPPAPEPVGHAAGRADLLALAALALLVLALFRATLFQSTHILGGPLTDMASQFVAWRKFGFDALARGDLALWNPYIFGGEPYFGGMQSALLYPPNVIFLALPLAAALNWSIAVNLWLLGAFMFAWARLRGLSPAGAFLAAAVVMLGGTVTPHIYAGHLPNLCTMPWAPLILLGIDGWLDRRRVRYLLIGMGAVAVQILAGHMQYVFFTAIAAGLYALFRLIQRRDWRAAPGLLLIYPAGAALAGVQLLTAIEASSESVRGGPVAWEFIKRFSLPPENMLSFLAPGFFSRFDAYWGQCYFWEMELFIGIAALAMVFVAALSREGRRAWPLWAALAATMLLALGQHTPLLWLLFKFVPGFDMFRGYSKFTFQASLFLALLAGMGYDSLRVRGPSRALFAALAIAGVVLFAGAAQIGTKSAKDWSELMVAQVKKPEFQSPSRDSINKPEFREQAQRTATRSLLIAAVTCAVLAGLFYRKTRWTNRALLGLALAELLVYANTSMVTFTMADLDLDKIKAAAGPGLGDRRILMMEPPNNCMLVELENVWGNDPYVLRRYAEFVTWANGGDPNTATQYVQFTKDVRGNALLRLGEFIMKPRREWIMHESQFPSMPHLLLAGKWRVSASRDEIFPALTGGSFNPWREAFVERDPGLGAPQAEVSMVTTADAGNGSARIVERSADALVIEADVLKPAVLVINDAYARGWRARAADGPARYEVMPANYWMRGIPLKPGRHKLILEYVPRSFAIGLWVTIVALGLYAAGWFWSVRADKGRNAAASRP
ncbi:MAG: hypothetical protein ABFD69_01165 [Candidatus Sumerlaeia bacterium]